MNEEQFQVLQGRQYGSTVFEGYGDDHWFKFKEAGVLIHEDEWEENTDLIVYREINERGNKSKSVLKVIGLINRLNLHMTKEKGLIVPKHLIKRVEDPKEKEYMSKIVRREYKTDEDIEFW